MINGDHKLAHSSRPDGENLGVWDFRAEGRGCGPVLVAGCHTSKALLESLKKASGPVKDRSQSPWMSLQAGVCFCTSPAPAILLSP